MIHQRANAATNSSRRALRPGRGRPARGACRVARSAGSTRRCSPARSPGHRRAVEFGGRSLAVRGAPCRSGIGWPLISYVKGPCPHHRRSSHRGRTCSPSSGRGCSAENARLDPAVRSFRRMVCRLLSSTGRKARVIRRFGDDARMSTSPQKRLVLVVEGVDDVRRLQRLLARPRRSRT